jgi:hypothetical protein
MKFYTHPKSSLTGIQTKDGALYTKRWLFFKPTLSLEIDLTSHRLWQLPEKIKFYDKSNKKGVKVSQNFISNQ